MLKGSKVKKKYIGHKVGYLVTRMKNFTRCGFPLMWLLRVNFVIGFSITLELTVS